VLSRVSIIALAAVGVAGCAQVSRFDDPLGSPYASRGVQREAAVAPSPARPAPLGPIESQPLPPTAAAPLPPPYAPRAPETTGSLQPPPARVAARGTQNQESRIRVTVNPGDTIDAIAHRYGTSRAAIMQANHITSPESIRPGQQLVVPHHGFPLAGRPAPAAPAPHLAAPAAPAPVAVQAPARAPAPSVAAAPSVPAAPGENVHVVKAGETLSSIAHHVHKSRAALAKANNLDEDAKLQIGQQLVLPGVKAAKPGPQAAATAPLPGQKPAPVTTASLGPRGAAPAPGSEAKPGAPAASVRMVSPSTETPASAGEPEGGSGAKLRWPVHGRIVCGFGCKANGQQNDGINVAVPEGTPVKAADDGVVAYAGNELKGYGNLVLVRHSNGFVTAYANASELMVKRGDQIKRGQVIAKSGQTGQAAAPQLHFEVRKGSTPVDPTQYLSGGI
jgi:murein DD-endopeptidase MepM/ murein hydrolase activator NlpD